MHLFCALKRVGTIQVFIGGLEVYGTVDPVGPPTSPEVGVDRGLRLFAVFKVAFSFKGLMGTPPDVKIGIWVEEI